jgi:hypothetical protein
MALKTLQRALQRIKDYFYPLERSIYVVKEGTFKGEWLVPVAFIPGHTVFFSLPDRHIRTIPNQEVEEGIKKNILNLVEILPKRVYNTCLAEYKLKLKQDDDALNRRKQHPTQGVLDRKQHRKTSSKFKRD